VSELLTTCFGRADGERTTGTALVVHPAPDATMLRALLCVCDNVIVMSASSGASKQLEPHPRVARHSYAGGQDVVALASEIARIGHVSVVPPVWEGGVEATAAICSALGLPGNSEAAAQAARDKYQAALCFERHGIPHPRTMLYSATAANQDRIEQQFSFPFILKSPWSTNSQSVTLVRSRDELSACLTMLRRLYSPDRENRLFGLYAEHVGQQPVLVQEYADGLELNIDLLLDQNTYRLLGAFEKYPMHGPTFEEVQSVYPPRVSISEMDECAQAAAAAARALGATIGAAHIELRLTSRGPVIIEAALRPGGFLTPQAISHLTGVHPVTALTRLLMTGELPDIDGLPDGVACLYGAVNCAIKGRIKSIFGEDSVRRDIQGLHAFSLLKQPGDRVVPLPLGTDYHVASFMLVGSCREPLEAAARRIRQCLRVEMG
jgi:biotin carboxylase